MKDYRQEIGEIKNKLLSVLGNIGFIEHTGGASEVGVENLRDLRVKLVDVKHKLYEILDVL